MNIGILGLGVMGRSLALNFERNGYSVAGFDLNLKFDKSLFKDKNIKIFDSLEELVHALDKPHYILIMVPAGKLVDKAILSIKPYLEKGDIVIDGGNSFFIDTERRLKHLSEEGIHFVGMGVSGGESGALWGPSLMPGGVESSWEQVKPMLESISAKADGGASCVAWMGKGGAGHYVKMVHNGIEYGDMQLIVEIYDLLHRGVGISNGELAEIFTEWNGNPPVKSYQWKVEKSWQNRVRRDPHEEVKVFRQSDRQHLEGSRSRSIFGRSDPPARVQ